MPGFDFKPINLGVRSNPYRKGRNAAARLINCYAEENGDEGRTQVSVYPDAGLMAFTALIEAGAGIRGGIVVDGAVIAALGRSLYRVSAQGVAAYIGGIPGDGPVYMDRNRNQPAQVGIVADGNYYVYTSGGGLNQINDSDLEAPNSFAFLEGYGILPSARRFSVTELDDFTDINALSFASNESYPDDTIGVATLAGEAVFFGTGSIEFWPNTGGEVLSLSRRYAIEIGCLSGASIAKVDTANDKVLIFVGADHTVRILSGSQAQVISTPEIENLIKDLAEAGRAGELEATAWASGGRFRYALSCADWTRVFQSGRGWTDKKSYGLSRWRVSRVFNLDGRLIAGDYATGRLYEMSDDADSEGDDPLVVQLVTPAVHAGPYRVRFDALALDLLTGTGVNTQVVEDDDPHVIVEASRDGGETYFAETRLSVGRMGETMKRLTWTRIGMSDRQGLVFRLTMSAAVFKRFDGAYVATTQLAA